MSAGGTPVRRIQVIGIGSGIGLDEAGWRLVQRLADMNPATAFPGLDLRFDNCTIPAQLPTTAGDTDVLVLIDAMQGARGAVRRIDPRDLEGAGPGCSSHGVDVAQALTLLPLVRPHLTDIRIYGIGIGETTEAPAASDELERIVDQALPVLVDALRR